MTEVRLGNDKAMEAYRDPESDDPDEVLYQPQDGEHITTMMLPDGLELDEQFFTVIGVAKKHMEEGGVPKWVESDDTTLETLLKDHWGITEDRPEDWGEPEPPPEEEPEG